jgi:AcrR family transcriptional regulator
MVRTKDPAVRALLIARAAHMLRVREPVTLRSLVAGTGVSTMAVYTYFGSMDGLWGALRQEGFRRLAARLETVARTDDPVRDLVALGAAYTSNAMAEPDLYRVSGTRDQIAMTIVL